MKQYESGKWAHINVKLLHYVKFDILGLFELLGYLNYMYLTFKSKYTQVQPGV